MKYVISGRVSFEILSKCDACYTFPCVNDGVCEPLPERKFVCRCTPGFHGQQCQYMIDACYGNPCRNTGTCKVLEEGRFRYYSKKIFYNNNETSENRYHSDIMYLSEVLVVLANFKNNINPTFKKILSYFIPIPQIFVVNSYVNTIQMSDKSLKIEQIIRIINIFHIKIYIDSVNILLNIILIFSCHCPAGFTGDRCESNIDDCINNKCENNATCNDLVQAYECKCQQGFMGK